MSTNPNQNERGEISAEAKEAARKCARDEPDHLASTAEYYYGVIVQDAINSALSSRDKTIAEKDEELKNWQDRCYGAENQITQQKEEIERLRHQIGTDFMAGVVIEKENQISQLEKQVLGLRDAHEKIAQMWEDEDKAAHEQFSAAVDIAEKALIETHPLTLANQELHKGKE